LNPFWDEFTLSLETICYGDLDWPLKITVYDFQQSGRHRIIGQCETTVNMLMERVAIRGNADRELAYEIYTEGKTKTRGLVVVLKADLRLEEKKIAYGQEPKVTPPVCTLESSARSTDGVRLKP